MHRKSTPKHGSHPPLNTPTDSPHVLHDIKIARSLHTHVVKIQLQTQSYNGQQQPRRRGKTVHMQWFTFGFGTGVFAQCSLLHVLQQFCSFGLYVPGSFGFIPAKSSSNTQREVCHEPGMKLLSSSLSCFMMFYYVLLHFICILLPLLCCTVCL